MSVLTVVVHEKGGKTQRVAFERDQFSVGREEDNDLVLDRANVSKHHLRLRRANAKVEVVDLESTNGTYLNGRKITDPKSVRRSDRIYVGDFILMLDGDDKAIVARERAEIAVAGPDGKPRNVPVGLVGGDPAVRAAPLPGAEGLIADDALLTSASRVAAPGMESEYLDKIANRILQTVLINVRRLDPLVSAEIDEKDQGDALKLIDSLIDDLRRAGELEEGINVTTLKGKIARELLEMGPLADLMKDDEVREIQVVGGGPIRVVTDEVKEGSGTRSLQKRFSGDRALVLAIQRMARTWGFLVEGAQVLEGKVGDGFYMYALLPPTAVRTPILSLRRTRTDANNLQALVQERVLNSEICELLSASVRGCRNILVCASGGVNLDRFMGALVGEVPEGMRVAAISDTGRLGAGSKGWIQVRRIADPADAVGLSDAVGVCLRGGLDMLISQRCRHEDAAAVIDAISGAAGGTIVSLWGIDSAHALSRLAALSTVASGAIRALTVALARSVDLLVRVGVGVNNEAMQVLELVEPRVKEGDEIVHMPLFRAMKGSDGNTDFQATGTKPLFLRFLTERGITVPMSIFKK
jgi:Flp pilus assembly CpaF family ATPase/pSer/pThr/pTyr-binding forkhead associated (FHA) protein